MFWMLEDHIQFFASITTKQSQVVKSLHLDCLHFIVISERYYFLKVSSKRQFLLSFFSFLFVVLLVAVFWKQGCCLLRIESIKLVRVLMLVISFFDNFCLNLRVPPVTLDIILLTKIKKNDKNKQYIVAKFWH